MSYDNTNRGTLGRNKRREKDTQPEYSGKINVEGVEYWLSGWVKESGGEKFFSLSVKRKDAPPQDRRQAEAPSGHRPMSQMIDDDLPF